MSGETAGLPGPAAGWSGRFAPGTCAGPASAPSSPSAPEPEAASWTDGGIPSPAPRPRRHPDAATMPARRGQSTYPEVTREVTAHGGIDPEGAPGGRLIPGAACVARIRRSDRSGTWPDTPAERHWTDYDRATSRPRRRVSHSSRGVPFLTEYPEIKSLFVNCGHYRNGRVSVLVSIRFVCSVILEGACILCPTP